MIENGQRIDRIARLLRQLGLQDIAAILLEFAGPFNYLGAQALYIAEPLLGERGTLFHDFARVLEDKRDISHLINSLQDKESTP
jgi:hypothetical protein